MKKFDPLKNIVVRTMSHANSNKRIVSRTKDDNKELQDVTAETFTNRKGNHPVDTNEDIIPSMADKRPVKPEKGMRKFKGSETIRRMEEKEDE